MSTSWTWWRPKERPLPHGQLPLAVDAFAEFEGLPAVGGQPGGERVLPEFARGGDEGAHRVGVVVPAGAGAGRPADEPGLAAAGAFEPHPGTALGVERERGDQLGVGGGPAREVEQFRLCGAGDGQSGSGGNNGGHRHGYRPGVRSLGGARRHAGGARGKGCGDANSAGRTTHAARIADEVHMDPPPQARRGVGHGPEYTMTARSGQPTVTMWTHSDGRSGGLTRFSADSRPLRWSRAAASPRPASLRPPCTGRPGVRRSGR